ncbi:MAG: urate hydroxylase PuuD, partial [Gemmatimonadales bacterium]
SGSLPAIPAGGDGPAPPTPAFAAVRAIIHQRCLPCHSAYPTDPTFGPSPGGVAFDTPERIARSAARIRVRAVATHTMPLGNTTGMTPAERAVLARWIAAGAPLR